MCADAMQTQRKLSVESVAGGGDYLWFAKKNQTTLLRDVIQFFEPPRRVAGWHIAPLPCTSTEQISTGHGRIERRLTLIQDEQQFLNWPALKQVFKLEHYVTHSKSGKSTCEVAYGITSSSADADQMLDWTHQ